MNGNMNPRRIEAAITSKSPHSLGTLIEWKRAVLLTTAPVWLLSPHSLGTLIEWKLAGDGDRGVADVLSSPLAGASN